MQKQVSTLPLRQRGLSLIELLVCLAIMLMLMTTALPNGQNMMKRSQSTAAINWLLEAIVYARQAAILRNTLVTLCPGPVDGRCKGEWHDELVVFTDANGNRRIDRNDVILERFVNPAKGSTIRWRAFQNKQYLQMTGEGFTNYQNGNFTYCPPDGDLRFARQLVINVQGRVRMGHDTDGDGIVEDRRGKDVRC